MPIYDFQCEGCGAGFEELVRDPGASVSCPRCGSADVRRRFSSFSPPGRQPRGARVRSEEGRRREREAARSERLAEAKRRRTAGEAP